MKTTIEQVSYALSYFTGHHKLANQWIFNDIIKKKIAKSYDDLVMDHIDQPEMLTGILAHVEILLIGPEILGLKKESSE